MSQRSWDGPDLLAALEAAVAALHARVDEVNALNVFPVPDGDTGTNMLATVQAAIAEARDVPAAHRTVPRVASAFSFGALMGARGNSGVILSQFFRGVSDALDGQRQIDGRDRARGFPRACEAAYAAVGQPVEGTLLTVARDLSTAARETAERDPSLEPVLAAAVDAAAASVERTPDLLPVLRQAGVVDAGGRGLELLLRGALAYVRQEAIPAGRPQTEATFPTFTLPEEEDQFGYETVCVIQPAPDGHLVLASIRDRLEEIGESVVVAGDERAVKIHVHNERPDQVLALALSLGTLSNVSIENLDGQTREVRLALEHHAPLEAGVRDAMAGPATAPGRLPLGLAAHPPTRLGPQVVAVAPGAGLARIFEGLGVSATVTGGQGANPSTGELAAAIRGTGSNTVLVLPNNPNAQLAAGQARELIPDVLVEVVPTRNAAEGVAAMLAFDPQADLPANAAQMLRGARGVQTMQVTTAIRDARLAGRNVQRGDHIVMGPDDELLAADPDRTKAVLDAVATLQPGFELVTIYCGDGVDAAQAAELSGRLAESLAGVEVEVVDGGQPLYSFLIAAE